MILAVAHEDAARLVHGHGVRQVEFSLAGAFPPHASRNFPSLLNSTTRELPWPPAGASAVEQSATTWRNAVFKQDEEALTQWLANGPVYAHSSGKPESKVEYIAAVTAGPSRNESFTGTNTVVRVYGKAAILEGSVEAKRPAGRRTKYAG